jgi:hypothetical protein
MKKKALSTSFRSATQATDSICKGCHANKAATKALRHTAPVICLSTAKRRSVLVMWNPRFTK